MYPFSQRLFSIHLLHGFKFGDVLFLCHSLWSASIHSNKYIKLSILSNGNQYLIWCPMNPCTSMIIPFYLVLEQQVLHMGSSSLLSILGLITPRLAYQYCQFQLESICVALKLELGSSLEINSLNYTKNSLTFVAMSLILNYELKYLEIWTSCPPFLFQIFFCYT